MSTPATTRFIVRLQGKPLRFPPIGRPVLYECVPSDSDATGFASAEEAVKMLHRRGLSPMRAQIVEVPAVPGKNRLGTDGTEGSEGSEGGVK